MMLHAISDRRPRRLPSGFRHQKHARESSYVNRFALSSCLDTTAATPMLAEYVAGVPAWNPPTGVQAGGCAIS